MINERVAALRNEDSARVSGVPQVHGWIIHLQFFFVMALSGWETFVRALFAPSDWGMVGWEKVMDLNKAGGLKNSEWGKISCAVWPGARSKVHNRETCRTTAAGC